MKALIMEASDKAKTIDAHTRNSLEIKRFLNERGHQVSHIFSNEVQKEKGKDWDVIVVSYASFYCNHSEMKRVIEENPQAKLFWITNEYDLQPNGSLSKLFRERGNTEVVANFDKKTKSFKFAKKIHSLNLNLLLFKPKERREKKYQLIYYGTYRKDRKKYFQKYISSEDFFLSTSIKNFKKFKSIGCKFKPIGKMQWGKTKDTLGLFKYSLYIEDEFTHCNFNNLANRFYEGVSNETVVLFDESCRNTLEKSEIGNENFERFIIRESKDISKRNYEEDLEIQQSWIPIIEEQRKKMLEELELILKGGR